MGVGSGLANLVSVSVAGWSDGVDYYGSRPFQHLLVVASGVLSMRKPLFPQGLFFSGLRITSPTPNSAQPV